MKKVQDFYFKKAKDENYKARSVFKLEEAQNKFKFIKSSDRVLDVGCSPGSFSQYMLNKILKSGCVVGVDILENSFSHQRFTFILGDIKDMDASSFDNTEFDVVVSDAMPNTTSDKETNHFRSISLCKAIFNLSKDVLKNGGNFFIKVFDGKDLQMFKKELSEYFESVNVFKPKSSRDESREVFLFCKNFKKLNN
ncbi:RlmE family RNA methyltransferase [uncultured Brachyspira sp.]|uniref:RlmE family RNA methyltransferase n=1 Tax=uncultured Brachyspira sp. TaxID=221953 RepID=UPI00263904BB|nr:RlmE family RNA methyltransferase [uncultured Brachyspira sp.]